MKLPHKEDRPIHLFILIDALGWEYVKTREFLDDILSYRQRVRTVLGFSSGAIPTILTGRPPAENGHWNLFYYDPKNSPFSWLKHFLWLPDSVLDNRVSRKIVKELGRRVLGMGPLFECFVSPRLMPFFNWVEKQSIYSPGGITGAKSIFDLLAEAQIPRHVYTYHEFRDEEIFSQARNDIAETHDSFFFLYLSEMDHFLHHHCDAPGQIDSELRRYGDRIRALYDFASSQSTDVTLTVFSDHGMTPVRNYYPLGDHVSTLGLRSPADFLSVFDSTMARFWFFNEAAREKVSELLAATPCGRILSNQELSDLGLGFPDDRYGQLIFLLHPGWLIANSDFNSGSWQPIGMHGYHPDDPYSDAVLLSNRAAPVHVRTVADVYQCLLEAV